MTDVIYCLVDPTGGVYTKDGADSYVDLAAAYGLDAETCFKYRYDLLSRRLLEDRGTPSGKAAARTYFAERLGTAARFMRFAADGHVPHQVLVRVLEPETRRPYLDACASIERKYTTDCAAANDPCLESGCSIDHEAGETCLQPLLRAGEDYEKACAAAWITLFERTENRIDAWRSN